MHFKAVFSFFAFFLLSVLCLSNDVCFAKGLTCDFYDISDIPDGWTVTVPPGFNERKSSLGHYVNEEKNTSLMIQIAENKDGSDLEEVTRQTLESLRSNGCTLLKEPVRQGELMRLEVTSTGIPSIMWLGTDGDVTSVTVLCGDMEEGRHFLSFFHADSRLIPSANLVFSAMNRRILFYGDSNTWGYRPGGERLPANRRYTTMVTRQAPDIIPLVDGVNGRNTAFESAHVPPELLGGASFAASLRKAGNPDGLVIMLGTNDVMPPLSLPGEAVADNIRRIIRTARQICPDMGTIIVVSPPPIAPGAVRAMQEKLHGEADLPGTDLAPYLKKAADDEGAYFLSGSSIIPCMDATDGIHLSDVGHLRIGLAIGSLLRSLAMTH